MIKYFLDKSESAIISLSEERNFPSMRFRISNGVFSGTVNTMDDSIDISYFIDKIDGNNHVKSICECSSSNSMGALELKCISNNIDRRILNSEYLFSDTKLGIFNIIELNEYFGDITREYPDIVFDISSKSISAKCDDFDFYINDFGDIKINRGFDNENLKQTLLNIQNEMSNSGVVSFRRERREINREFIFGKVNN